MLRASMKWIAPILAVLALAAAQAPSAQAGFTLTVIEDGNVLAPFTNPGPGVLVSDLGTISVDVSFINPLLQFFSVNSLSITTNSVGAFAGSGNDEAKLIQTGAVQLLSGIAGNHTLEIVAFDDGYTFPTGSPRSMTTSASNTFQNGVATNRTFQSTYDDSVNPAVTSALMSFTPTAGNLSPSVPDEHDAVSSVNPYSLSNTSVITLGPGSSTIGFSGTTLITAVAVPEPSSMALGLISLPALLALGRRMRRRLDV